MFWTMDSVNGFACIYFITLLFLGSYFVLNLALAVIVYQHGLTVMDDEALATSDVQTATEPPSSVGQHAAAAAARLMAAMPPSVAGCIRSACAAAAALWARLRDLEELLHTHSGTAPLVAACAAVTESRMFDAAVISTVLANVAVLCAPYEGMPASYAHGLETANVVFCVVFCAEQALRMAAMGIAGYFGPKSNWFDCLINIASVADLLSAGAASVQAVRVLRLLRILRVLKLANRVRSLQIFLSSLLLTVASLGNFVCLVALVVFVFALFGMQIFGGKLDGLGDGGELPRLNFDSLQMAVIAVLSIITGEKWVDTMVAGMRAKGDAAALYFITVVVVGTYVVVNLFIAILLVSFESCRRALAQRLEEEQEEKAKREKAVRFAALLVSPKLGGAAGVKAPGGASAGELRLARSNATLATPSVAAAASLSARRHGTLVDVLRSEAAAQLQASSRSRSGSGAGQDGPATGSVSDLTGPAAWLEKRKADVLRLLGLQQAPAVAVEDSALDASSSQLQPESGAPARGPRRAATLSAPRAAYTGMLWLHPYHPLRRFATAVVCHPQFDNGMLAVILASSITLAIDSPAVALNPVLSSRLYVCDVFFTVLFCAEMGLKLLAQGVVGQGSYFWDSWNWLDAVVVAFALVDISSPSSDLSWIKVVRVARALRPLRMIRRVPELRVVVQALLMSVSSVGSVSAVCALFYILFGVSGMSMFGGKLWYCDGDATPRISEAACVAGGNRWQRRVRHFDDIWASFLTLFQLTTGSNWSDILFDLGDATGSGTGPERDANIGGLWFTVG